MIDDNYGYVDIKVFKNTFKNLINAIMSLKIRLMQYSTATLYL